MGSSGEAEPLRVAPLGPVLAWRGDRELALGPGRRQAVLIMPALRAGRVVSRDELVDVVKALTTPSREAQTGPGSMTCRHCQPDHPQLSPPSRGWDRPYGRPDGR
jgi:hypothetical protein